MTLRWYLTYQDPLHSVRYINQTFVLVRNTRNLSGPIEQFYLKHRRSVSRTTLRRKDSSRVHSNYDDRPLIDEEFNTMMSCLRIYYKGSFSVGFTLILLHK